MVNRSALKLRGSRSSSEYFITVKFDPQIRLIRSKSKSVEPRPEVEAVPGLAGRSILRSEASDIRLTEVQAPEFWPVESNKGCKARQTIELDLFRGRESLVSRVAVIKVSAERVSFYQACLGPRHPIFSADEG